MREMRGCAEHRQLCKNTKQCEAAECNRIPSFSRPGEVRGRFCAEHRLPGMEDVKNQKCEAAGCKRVPSFNTLDKTCGRFCAEHRLPGMEDVKNQKCEAAGCKRTPSFNAPGETRGRFCAEHQLAGMEDVKNKKCEATGCKRVPSFNAVGETHGRFCAEHQLPGMEDVKNKKCEAAGCKRWPSFNRPGVRASYCSEHRQSGMIRNPRVRCCKPWCTDWSTHGRTGPLRCEAHALHTDTNLVERVCVGCALPMIVSCTGHCEFCDPTAANKRRRLAKQHEIGHFLAVHLPDHPPDATDRTPGELRACGDRERPDFFWDRGHLCVLLEVDEEQHAGRACECEQARMINISQVLDAPHTLWVRFNPDAYEAPGGPAKPAIRRDTLRRVLLQALQASPETCADWPVIGVMQLFFDGFRPECAAQVQSLDHFLP